MIKKCIFCGKSREDDEDIKFSNEHVFPQWLQKELNIEKELISPTRFCLKKKKIKSKKREHYLKDLKCKAVCEKCNNGWMSLLETEVKPLLKILIKNKKDISSLTLKEREVIARWFIKTASMLNYSSDIDNFLEINKKDLLFLKNKIPNNNYFVLGTQHNPTKKFYWIQGQTALIWDEKDFNIEDYNKNYKIVMQFGSLILLFAYLDKENSNYFPVLVGGVHNLFWPQSSKKCCFKEDKDSFPFNNSELANISFWCMFDFCKPHK
ncbi:MAG: hypothetical protein WC414_00580 [Patescibacteria group bacterium]